MTAKDWNPELYLKYGNERTQPAIDLASRIRIDEPKKIIDIGCGPGNSTQILVQRWPDAKIIGIDNSPAMITKAKKDFPELEWKILDAGKDEIKGKYDIVYSNAAIQWIPDHDKLLKKFHNILDDEGVVAVQIPLFWDMSLGKAIKGIARGSRWSSATNGVEELFNIHEHSFYYDELSKLFGLIEMWETHFMHILDSQLSILEMIRSTGLKPFLERLEREADKKDFEREVFEQIKIDYPLQENGKVIFPFKRLFFIAYK